MPTTPLLLLLAAMTALPATAQPLPDFPPSDGLPPGLELCGGPIVPDLPFGEPWPAVSAATELPEPPAWCDGTCVIDIAFIYSDEAIEVTDDQGNPAGPQSVGELRRRIDEAINHNNVAWRRAGLDAELRFVGVERDSGLHGLPLQLALSRGRERVPEFRRKYGADLLYAITGGVQNYCGQAYLRGKGVGTETPAYKAAGAVFAPCLGYTTLAHEVGHNLGLVHNPADTLSP